jgi:hypothetical protein
MRGSASVAVGLLGVVLGGCTASGTARDDMDFPERIVVPPCEARRSRVALSKVTPDHSPRKPSLGLEHFLIDLRVEVLDSQDLWLLVDHDSFPSGVQEVTRLENDNWVFSGNDIVHARWLGRSANLPIENVQVSTSDRRTPVVLGAIEIENLSPQRWVREGGRSDHRVTRGRRLVHSGIDVVCATWFDLGADMASP